LKRGAGHVHRLPRGPALEWLLPLSPDTGKVNNMRRE
jgi:hypothetical protein